MAHILLTGATGLIGRATTKALIDAGHEVTAVSRSGQATGATHSVACDVLVPEQVSAIIHKAKATHLMHLAWHDGAKDRWISAANLNWMAATLHLIQEFARAGGTRAICAGSCAEYDWSETELTRTGMPETTPLRPRTLYGAAKAGTGLALGQAGPALGLSIGWARIFFVYGPGEPQGRLLGDLIRNLMAGEPVACTDGLQERDFLHVDDLARAMVQVLGSEVTGAVNIASGIVTPVRGLINEVATQMGRTDLIRLGAVPRAANDPARLAADVTRLRQEAGFRPHHDIASGVAAVLAAEGAV